MKQLWVKLMIILNIILVINVRQKVVYANTDFGNLGIYVYDELGNEIDAVSDYYTTQNSVYFSLDENQIDEDEIYLTYMFWEGDENPVIKKLPENYLCISPVLGKRLIVNFSVKNVKTGQERTLDMGDVDFCFDFEVVENSILYTFKCSEYKEIDGIHYLNGEKPVIYVKQSDLANTKIDIYENASCMSYEVLNEMELSFDPGEYTVYVYTESDDGSLNYAKDFPITFVYDNKPVEDVKIVLDGYYREESNVIYTAEIKACVEAYDDLSGIEEITMIYGEDTYNSSEISMKEGKNDEIRASIIDNCGNVSSTYIMNQEIVVDKKAPDIKISYKENGIVDILITDECSGLYESEIYINDELIRDENYSGKKIDDRNFEIAISGIPVENISSLISVRAIDKALNESISEMVFECIDESAPRVSIGGVNNMGYYNSDVEVEVKITDTNIDISSTKIQVRFIDVDGNETNKIYTDEQRLFFEEEGKYEVSVYGRDLNGNQSFLRKEFVIDKTAPLIKGLDLFNENYLPEFNVKNYLSNMFYDQTLVKYRMYVNGEEINSDKIITDKGHYSYVVQAMDQAGNIAADQAEFVVYTLSENAAKNAQKEQQKLCISANNYNEKMDGNITLEVIGDSVHRKKNLIYLIPIFSILTVAILVIVTIFRKKRR